MNDRIPAEGKAGRVLITPENGSAPFYATVTMADEPLDEGTPLNKATLLKDATAALLGGDETMVPDEAFALLKTLHNDLALDVSSRPKGIAIGSYVGNGNYGSGSPTVLSFNFPPQLVVVGIKDSTEYYIFFRNASGGFTNSDATVTWGDSSVSWYAADAESQLNQGAYVQPGQGSVPANTYLYIAFG